jgi:signal peptidase I
LNGKVNSESDSNENSFEMKIHEFRNKGEGSFLVFVEGLSMYPLFEPGSRVPVKLMPSGTEYDVGDIIVFKGFDSYIIHVVIDKYVYKGKTYYVTGGLNQETNPFVDCTTISGDKILGLADFSENFIAGTYKLESQGLLIQIEALGMSNQFEIYNERIQELKKAIADIEEINDIDEINAEEKFDRILKLMDEISTTEYADVLGFSEYSGKDGYDKFNQDKWNILGKSYYYLRKFVAKEFKVTIDENIKLQGDLDKAFNIIKIANEKYDLKNSDANNGIELYKAEITSPDDIAGTGVAQDNEGIIRINIILEESMIINLFLPHELSHLKIRKIYDSICEGNNIECRKDTGAVSNGIAIEIEEFLVDANNLISLDGQKKLDYAREYCDWLDLLLSEKWSGFTDENGNLKLVNELTSREMLTIMHHKVILEYIQNNVLRNNREVDAIIRRIDDYYKKIITHLSSLDFDLNIENHINKYILEKFRSYFNRMHTLEEYLTFFPIYPDLDHRGETWIEYISNVLFPSFEYGY